MSKDDAIHFREETMKIVHKLSKSIQECLDGTEQSIHIMAAFDYIHASAVVANFDSSKHEDELLKYAISSYELTLKTMIKIHEISNEKNC